MGGPGTTPMLRSKKNRESKKTNAQRHLSSGAVVARNTSADMLFLMLRAFNHWDFPKGIVEAGKAPKQAALREETSICDLAFPRGDVFLETSPYNHIKVGRYYLGVTQQRSIESPVNPEIGRAEHSEYRWVG